MYEDLSRINASPIVVGGNGGSGTRAVAQILRRAGVFFGADLNDASDNLLFTYFFKHPRRYAALANRPSAEHGDFQGLLRLHEQVLLGKRPATTSDWRILLLHGWLHAWGSCGLRWVLTRWWKMARARPYSGGPWGFKEPHTMFFLHGLHRRYATGRYILVLRNGLDMVYSDNDQHFQNWGPSYGIDPVDLSPRNKFEFWYRSNKQVLDMAPRWLGGRFLTVRLEELCLDLAAVPALLRFVGIEDEATVRDCRKILKLPASTGRYRRFDTSWIDAEVQAKLVELAYARLR